MKAIVITHKETEFYFISWELPLKWMLFFVIFMQTVDLWSGLVTHSGYLIGQQVTHAGFTSLSGPSSFPFLFRERWAALAVIYNKRETHHSCEKICLFQDTTLSAIFCVQVCGFLASQVNTNPHGSVLLQREIFSV